VESLRDHPDVKLPPEIGATYRENAIAKARAVSDALDKLGLTGAVAGIHRVSTERRVSGRVVTVTVFAAWANGRAGLRRARDRGR